MHLSLGDSAVITLCSSDRYGGTPTLRVEKGEVYSFDCPPGQRWKDWFVPCGPEGFVNPALWLSGRRLKGVKCFCLCGALGKNEAHLFKIGSQIDHYKVPTSDRLYFFANDAWGAYWNNKGAIQVIVQRIK